MSVFSRYSRWPEYISPRETLHFRGSTPWGAAHKAARKSGSFAVTHPRLTVSEQWNEREEYYYYFREFQSARRFLMECLSFRLVATLAICLTLNARAAMAQEAPSVGLAARAKAGLPPVGSPPNAPVEQKLGTKADDGLVQLNFPNEIELKGLIDYVSQRLNVKILYDDQIANKKVSIKGPGEIPANSLMGLLESALKMKGLALEDAEAPGWKRVTSTAKLPLIAKSEDDAQRAIDKFGATAAVTQAFLLVHADPQQVDSVIKPFLTQPGANSVAIKDPNMLIVSDYASNVLKVGRLVKLLDQAKPNVVLEFVAVKNLEASALAQQLTMLLAARAKAKGANAGAVANAEITHDARTNQLMLVGTREQAEEVIALARTLDVPLGLSTQVYTLHHASADRVERLIKELIDPIDAKRLYKSAVDAEGNLLIVTATPEIHQRIASIQQRLDVPSARAHSLVRFYKLKNVKATDVLETIRAMEGKSNPESAQTPRAGGGNAQGGNRLTAAGMNAPAPNTPPGAMGGGMAPPRSPAGQAPLATGPQANGPQGNLAAETPATAEGGPPLSVESSNARITADTNTNSIIVVAEPAVQAMYEELITSLDRRRPQVLIEAKVVSIDTSDDFQLGIDVSGLHHHGLLAFTSQGLSKVDPVSGALSVVPGLGFNGALIDPNSADVVLRSLSNHRRAKVLSAPRILVNDNATGVLTSVSEVPYTSVNASQTVATTSFAGFAKAGTTINVTPHIGEGDHVQLEYTVTLNSFTGAGASGVPPPRQTDEVESKVVVPDGHTIIVGGLNRRNPSKSLSGPAILTEIPVLKYVFSNRTKSQQNTSMFVFLRPIILRDDKFQDLKFLSSTDMKHAELHGDMPHSEPLLIH